MSITDEERQECLRSAKRWIDQAEGILNGELDCTKPEWFAMAAILAAARSLYAIAAHGGR